MEPVELSAYRSGAADWFGLTPASRLSAVQPFAGPLVPGTTRWTLLRWPTRDGTATGRRAGDDASPSRLRPAHDRQFRVPRAASRCRWYWSPPCWSNRSRSLHSARRSSRCVSRPTSVPASRASSSCRPRSRRRERPSAPTSTTLADGGVVSWPEVSRPDGWSWHAEAARTGALIRAGGDGAAPGVRRRRLRRAARESPAGPRYRRYCSGVRQPASVLNRLARGVLPITSESRGRDPIQVGRIKAK